MFVVFVLLYKYVIMLYLVNSLYCYSSYLYIIFITMLWKRKPTVINPPQKYIDNSWWGLLINIFYIKPRVNAFRLSYLLVTKLLRVQSTLSIKQLLQPFFWWLIMFTCQVSRNFIYVVYYFTKNILIGSSEQLYEDLTSFFLSDYYSILNLRIFYDTTLCINPVNYFKQRLQAIISANNLKFEVIKHPAFKKIYALEQDFYKQNKLQAQLVTSHTKTGPREHRVYLFEKSNIALTLTHAALPGSYLIKQPNLMRPSALVPADNTNLQQETCSTPNIITGYDSYAPHVRAAFSYYSELPWYWQYINFTSELPRIQTSTNIILFLKKTNFFKNRNIHHEELAQDLKCSPATAQKISEAYNSLQIALLLHYDSPEIYDIFTEN